MSAQWRSGSYHESMEDTQAIEHGDEKVLGTKTMKVTARTEEAQHCVCRPVRTPFYHRWGGKQLAVYHTYAECQVENKGDYEDIMAFSDMFGLAVVVVCLCGVLQVSFGVGLRE